LVCHLVCHGTLAVVGGCWTFLEHKNIQRL
jgi:hypothetical protein